MPWRCKCKFVCPVHCEAKRYQNVRACSRERFIAGPGEEMGGSCPKKPWAGRRVSEYVIGSCTGLWLADGGGAGWYHRVGFISPQALGDRKLCAHGHQVISIFHLVGFSHLWSNSGNVHQILLGRHLREELQQRGRGWLCPGKALQGPPRFQRPLSR